MEKFTRITSVAAPLMQANIDTDTIIPMSRYVTAEIDTLHQFAFEPLRFNADGSENPNFALNQRAFRGAHILIVGPNFGCGSSRETAVWAIAGLGIRCIIAPSFGSIFYANCFQSGLLPVVVPLVTVEAFAVLAETEPERAEFTVNLETCQVVPPKGASVSFQVEPFRRVALLEGLDDIGLTMKHDEEIADFQRQDRQQRPWIYLR